MMADHLFDPALVASVIAAPAAALVLGAAAWLAVRLAPKGSVADAFLALGLMLTSYGLTEVVHGYGFLAVFVAAVTFRRFEVRHAIHGDLHHFVEQTEVIGLIAVMFVLGMAVGQGLLRPARWRLPSAAPTNFSSSRLLLSRTAGFVPGLIT